MLQTRHRSINFISKSYSIVRRFPASISRDYGARSSSNEEKACSLPFQTNGCISLRSRTHHFQSCIFISQRRSNSNQSKSNDPNPNQIVPRANSSAPEAQKNELQEIDYSAVIPINFDTSSSIQGEESQILEVHLEPNQLLRAESGAMIYMTQGVQMSTSLGSSGSGGASGSGSGLSEGFKRMLTGQNMFVSDYTYHGPEGTKGTLALGTEFPSKIMRLSLEEYGHKIICQKSAYLASDLNVDIQMEFTKKFGTGFFGGEGFILQGLVGDGDVFIKAGGYVQHIDIQYV